LLFDAWSGGNADGTHFINNIFYVDGRVTYDWGQSTNNEFDSNVFYGAHVEMPSDARATTHRPPLLAPGSGGQGLNSLPGYTLRADANFPRGQIVPNNGGRDFFGHPVPENQPPSIGACQSSP
jgi:hypothetical protein